MTKTRLLKVEQLLLDKNLHPRIETSWRTSYQYAQAIRSGSVFPPIIVGVFEGKYYVVDGWHRVKAYQYLKEEYVEALIRKFKDKREMFVEAVRLNNSHGKQISVQDKVRIIDKLAELKFSLKEISKIVRVPLDKIELFQARVVTRPDGSKVYLKGVVANAISKTEVKLEDAQVSQVQLGAPSVANLLKQLIALLESNIYPLEDENVQNLTVKLFDLLREQLQLA